MLPPTCQEEDCLKRVNCSESYGASEPVKKDGHLACFVEHAVSISTFLDTQGFFQEAKVKDVCTGAWLLKNHMSVKKWPILDIRTGQLSKR